MANSWGHTLQRLTSAQLNVLARTGDSECRTSRCGQPATHLVTYRYVTGQAGRASFARKHVCDRHAGRFRITYDLPEPVAAPAPQHVLERLVGEGTSFPGWPKARGGGP